MALGLVMLPACTGAGTEPPTMAWIGPADRETDTSDQTPATDPTTTTAPPTTAPATIAPTTIAPTAGTPIATTPPEPSSGATDAPGPPSPEDSNPSSAAPDAAPLAEHTVLSGEHLWSIAAAHLAAVSPAGQADDAAVARYWRRLIDENRSILRSGNADLIYPGEVLRLPAVESNR